MHDLSSTISILTATPSVLHALLSPLPAVLLQTSESPTTWTPTEVVAHLVHGERTDWMPRVRIILRSGETETFPAFQREAHRSAPLPAIADLLAEFTRLRTESLTELRSLNLTPADLARTGRHPAFGVVTLSQLLATWATHDLTHLHQISRTLAFQNRDAVGPWKQYLGVLQCDGHSGKA
jgi:hypothetical protein